MILTSFVYTTNLYLLDIRLYEFRHQMYILPQTKIFSSNERERSKSRNRKRVCYILGKVCSTLMPEQRERAEPNKSKRYSFYCRNSYVQLIAAAQRSLCLASAWIYIACIFIYMASMLTAKNSIPSNVVRWLLWSTADTHPYKRIRKSLRGHIENIFFVASSSFGFIRFIVILYVVIARVNARTQQQTCMQHSNNIHV